MTRDIFIICQPEDILNSIQRALNLLSREELESRNVNESLKNKSQDLVSFLNFLREIIEKTKPRSYSKLLEILSKEKVPENFENFLVSKGLIIEALSVLTLEDKKIMVWNYLERSLKRTGEIDDELFLEIKNQYKEELLNATALYYLLKVVGDIEGISLLSQIRGNIGSRTIEEYFADLIAGWIFEEYLKKKIKNTLPNEFEVSSVAVDKDRKIMFGGICGESDFVVEKQKKETYPIEVQRVGEKSSKFENDYLLIEVKEHKLEKSNILIFLFMQNFSLKSVETDLIKRLKGKALIVKTIEYVLDERKLENLENFIEKSSFNKRTKNSLKKRISELKKKKEMHSLDREIKSLFNGLASFDAGELCLIDKSGRRFSLKRLYRKINLEKKGIIKRKVGNKLYLGINKSKLKRNNKIIKIVKINDFKAESIIKMLN